MPISYGFPALMVIPSNGDKIRVLGKRFSKGLTIRRIPGFFQLFNKFARKLDLFVKTPRQPGARWG